MSIFIYLIYHNLLQKLHIKNSSRFDADCIVLTKYKSSELNVGKPCIPVASVVYLFVVQFLWDEHESRCRVADTKSQERER